MASQYPYRQTIRNEFLGTSKIIRAMTLDELHWLTAAQHEKWQEQETRKRQQQDKEAERAAARQHTESQKAQADEDTERARQAFEELRNILGSSLRSNPSVDWEMLLDRRSFPAFQFSHPKPDRDAIRLQLLGSEPQERVLSPPRFRPPGFLEVLLPFLRDQRLKREEAARQAFEREQYQVRSEFVSRWNAYKAREKDVVDAFNSQVRVYNAALKLQKEQYDRDRDVFLAQQQSHNGAINDFRKRYEEGTPEAVERYMQMVLERSSYPEAINGEPEVRYDEASRTLIVSF